MPKVPTFDQHAGRILNGEQLRAALPVDQVVRVPPPQLAAAVDRAGAGGGEGEPGGVGNQNTLLDAPSVGVVGTRFHRPALPPGEEAERAVEPERRVHQPEGAHAAGEPEGAVRDQERISCFEGGKGGVEVRGVVGGGVLVVWATRPLDGGGGAGDVHERADHQHKEEAAHGVHCTGFSTFASVRS